MVVHELLTDDAILIVTPQEPLAAGDFVRLAAVVDPVIAQSGPLNGLMLVVERFPGWTDFDALSAHMRFVRSHHRKIKKVAVVTDSRLLALLPRVASLYLHPEIRVFRRSARDAALDWLKTNKNSR